VAWAPNVGRRFHYIASAEGSQLRIYKLLRETKISTGSNDDKTNEMSLTLESTQTIAANSAWRCQWNVVRSVQSVVLLTCEINKAYTICLTNSFYRFK
jgi:hypothetical protein